jgi:hypothetical protein
LKEGTSHFIEQGAHMKSSFLHLPVPVIIVLLSAWGVSSNAQVKWVTPYVNEVSFYKNLDDLGRSRGTTLQIISINGFNIGTDFVLEFTGDFNWEMDPFFDRDHYIELSLVKPVFKSLSLNYQRIYSTFYDEPVNQFGFRLSLFSGS